MRRSLLAVMVAGQMLATGPVRAQDTAVPATAPQTVQQLFDAATDAMQAGRHAEAAALYTTLETRAARNARSLAIVRVRKAMALVELSRWDEARALLEQAAPALPKDDPSLANDRMDAAFALGRTAAGDLDYEGALRSYQTALKEAAQPLNRFRALLRMAAIGTFIDPVQALGWTDEALVIARDDKIVDKVLLGQAANIRGAVLLNLGRFAEAEGLLKEAVSKQGGLSLKVDYSDLVARSDAAIAAMLAGHRTKAREYLAYTGAGRLPKQDFTTGADMELPDCGIDDIRPEDVAVVEFGIGEDGAVSYARPIYGSRQGPLALTFARAVARWSWRPETVKDIPPLFRMVTRLELRCSVRQGGPSILSRANSELWNWLADKGVLAAPVPAGGAAAQRAALLAAAQRVEAADGEKALQRVPVYLGLLSNPLATREDVEAHGPAVERTLAQGGAPLLAQLAAEVVVHSAADRLDIKYGAGSPFEIDAARYQGDAEARATLAIQRYDSMKSSAKPRFQAEIDRIIADPALPADAPIKVAALVRRASQRAVAKDMTGAQQDFAATGLTAQQCSIVDAKPSLRSAPTSSADYPMDLVNIGVEGWTVMEFDIAADGSTRNARPVITYPPMTFGPNGEKIVARARFEQSYRPEGELGCGGSNTRINFVRPQG